MDAIDPSDHTVKELEAVLPDIDDREILSTLLEEERSGKKRKTAIEVIEERLDTIVAEEQDQEEGQVTETAQSPGDAFGNDDEAVPSGAVDDEVSRLNEDEPDSDPQTTGSAQSNDETVQVLTFTLGDENYCVGIDHVTEIVEAGDVTSIPNAPDHVEGMMDLRGETTTIIDPRGPLGIESNGSANGSRNRIVVFDPDGFEHGSATGWTVDDVHNVLRISRANVDTGPVETDGVNGVVKREGDFLIWVSPEALTG